MSVVKVNKLKPGWEPIPNSFACDLRLSEDAVAVGLWLSIKPEGWQVRPAVIQAEFSRRPGKIRGKEWWSRVSAELKIAGYLRLNACKDAKGQFSSSWDFCVSGLSTSFTEVGFDDDGSADHGSAGSGSTPQSNHYPFDSAPKANTTHHNNEAGAPAKPGVCVEVDTMLLEAQLSAGMRKLIGAELVALDTKLQVAVVREFLAHRSSIRHPVPWMRRVCTDTALAGEFVPAAKTQQPNSSAAPVKHTCELAGCTTYAVTQTSRGWRCSAHIGK